MRQEKYPEEKARLLAHRSLDESLNKAEEALLESVYHDYPELRVEVENLQEMRQLLQSLQPAPSTGFAQQVIQSLPAKVAWYRPLVRSWSAVAAAACIALVFALSFIYLNSGTLETEAILGLEEIVVEDAYAFE